MKLGKAWDTYKEHNLLYSANARQLAFAIGAICWLFRIEEKTNTCSDITFPPFIITALLFIVIFVLSDLTQYLYQTVAFRKQIKSEEKRIKKEQNTNKLTADMIIQIPGRLHKPAITLLFTKTTALYIAGFLLLAHFMTIIAQ
ncbi:MAG: hypothetical protein P8010_00355 [Desulfosarcinaceae bacterium]|jgi:hypothetical protein